MKRIELIFSQSLETDLLEAFKKYNVGNRYTKISNVFGKGYSDPKLGDSVWPQVNCLYIIYCKKEEYQTIKKIVAEVKEEYPDDGLALFKT